MFAMKFRGDGCLVCLNMGAEAGDNSLAAQSAVGIQPEVLVI